MRTLPFFSYFLPHRRAGERSLRIYSVGVRPRYSRNRRQGYQVGNSDTRERPDRWISPARFCSMQSAGELLRIRGHKAQMTADLRRIGEGIDRERLPVEYRWIYIM